MGWKNGTGSGVGASGSDANSFCCQEPFKRVMEW